MALFGKRKRGGYNPLATESMGAEAPQMPTGGAMATYGAMTPGQGMAAPQAAPSVDWGNIARNVLGNVGDAVSTYYGGPRVFAEQEAIQRQGAMLAEQQRQAAMLQAQRLAAQAIPKPGSFEWYQGANDEERALYDQYNPFTVATGGGPVRVPRSPANPNRPAMGARVSRKDLGL